jgi:hypothetical protein
MLLTSRAVVIIDNHRGAARQFVVTAVENLDRRFVHVAIEAQYGEPANRRH